jgi:hypothetical protein
MRPERERIALSGRYKLEGVRAPSGEREKRICLDLSPAEWRSVVEALVAYANRSTRRDYGGALKIARRIAEAQGLTITDDKA